MAKYLNFSYLDIMSMPVFERKFLLNMLVEEKQKETDGWENSKKAN